MASTRSFLGVPSNNRLLVSIEPAKLAAGFELGPIVDQNGGPKGALVDSFLFKRQVTIVLDGQNTAPAQPLSWDLSAYSSVQRPTAPHDDGFLGAEFMLANQAIIDFGTETLFIAVQK